MINFSASNAREAPVSRDAASLSSSLEETKKRRLWFVLLPHVRKKTNKRERERQFFERERDTERERGEVFYPKTVIGGG
jgi:hypothetical protein